MSPNRKRSGIGRWLQDVLTQAASKDRRFRWRSSDLTVVAAHVEQLESRELLSESIPGLPYDHHPKRSSLC